jgi:hypothetical protein
VWLARNVSKPDRSPDVYKLRRKMIKGENPSFRRKKSGRVGWDSSSLQSAMDDVVCRRESELPTSGVSKEVQVSCTFEHLPVKKHLNSLLNTRARRVDSLISPLTHSHFLDKTSLSFKEVPGRPPLILRIQRESG